MKALAKFNEAITKIDEWIIIAFAIVMVLSCFAQVVTRAIGMPLSWSEELSRYMAVWLTFLGAAYAHRKKSLVAVEILINALKGSGKKVLYIVISILILIFCYVLIRYGGAFAQKFMGQKSPAMQIPKGIVYLSAPVCGVMITLFQIEQMVDTLGHGKEEKS